MPEKCPKCGCGLYPTVYRAKGQRDYQTARCGSHIYVDTGEAFGQTTECLRGEVRLKDLMLRLAADIIIEEECLQARDPHGRTDGIAELVPVKDEPAVLEYLAREAEGRKTPNADTNGN